MNNNNYNNIKILYINKYLKARKELISIVEEILEIKQLNDGRLAMISNSITNNKLVFYSKKIKDIDIKNKNIKTYFTIEELQLPITSINQSADQTLLILTLDSTILLIKLNDNDNNKYSIIQKLNAAISNSNAIKEKEKKK